MDVPGNLFETAGITGSSVSDFTSGSGGIEWSSVNNETWGQSAGIVVGQTWMQLMAPISKAAEWTDRHPLAVLPVAALALIDGKGDKAGEAVDELEEATVNLTAETYSARWTAVRSGIKGYVHGAPESPANNLGNVDVRPSDLAAFQAGRDPEWLIRTIDAVIQRIDSLNPGTPMF